MFLARRLRFLPILLPLLACGDVAPVTDAVTPPPAPSQPDTPDTKPDPPGPVTAACNAFFDPFARASRGIALLTVDGEPTLLAGTEAGAAGTLYRWTGAAVAAVGVVPLPEHLAFKGATPGAILLEKANNGAPVPSVHLLRFAGRTPIESDAPSYGLLRNRYSVAPTANAFAVGSASTAVPSVLTLRFYDEKDVATPRATVNDVAALGAVGDRVFATLERDPSALLLYDFEGNLARINQLRSPQVSTPQTVAEARLVGGDDAFAYLTGTFDGRAELLRIERTSGTPLAAWILDGGDVKAVRTADDGGIDLARQATADAPLEVAHGAPGTAVLAAHSQTPATFRATGTILPGPCGFYALGETNGTPTLARLGYPAR